MTPPGALKPECLLLAISGLFGGVPRTSALPPKADIKNWVAAVALIASAIHPKSDIRESGSSAAIYQLFRRYNNCPSQRLTVERIFFGKQLLCDQLLDQLQRNFDRYQ